MGSEAGMQATPRSLLTNFLGFRGHARGMWGVGAVPSCWQEEWPSRTCTSHANAPSHNHHHSPCSIVKVASELNSFMRSVGSSLQGQGEVSACWGKVMPGQGQEGIYLRA